MTTVSTNVAQPLVVQFATVKSSRDAWPRQHEIAWDQLAQGLADHRVGPKDGPAICCGIFRGKRRKADELIGRGLQALDIEVNKETGEVPVMPSVVAERLAAKGLAASVSTTHSHLPELPRYRIVMPLSAPLALFDEDPAAHEIDRLIPALAASQLGLSGVLDRGKLGAESLFFLPRHDEGRPFWSTIVPGDPIDALELRAVAFMVHHQERMDERQVR